MRFSKTKKKPFYEPADTINLAGGPAYKQSPKLELVSLVLSTFLNDSYYESANGTLARLLALLNGEDSKFAAKLALFARNECGMRTVTNVIAAMVAKLVKGENWVRRFIAAVVRRPDDAVEILACYISLFGKPVPNSLKKGLGDAIVKFNGYQLAKYRCASHEISLVDLVNIVHPVPNEKNAEAFKELVGGTLRSFDTWEVELSKAGSIKNEKDKNESKGAVWTKLIGERKLGMLALTKNLRNIAEQADLETVKAAAEMLRNADAVQKSLVMPFRFVDAYFELKAAEPSEYGTSSTLHYCEDPEIVILNAEGSMFLSEKLYKEKIALQKAKAEEFAKLKEKRNILKNALHDAVELSLASVPKFKGNTVIMLDCSGSMSGRPYQIGATFAGAIARTNKADVVLFDTDARFLDLSSGPKRTLRFVEAMAEKFTGGGTDFDCAFKLLEQLNARYDRIVILSDMQAWVSDHACQREFARYTKRCGGDPKLFSFDLAGHGTMQFPEKSVYCVAGWSDKALELFELLDNDINALVNRIEAMQL